MMSKVYTDKEVDQIVKKRLERAKKVHSGELYKVKVQAEKTAAERFAKEHIALKNQLSKAEVENGKQVKQIAFYEMMDKARTLLAENNITITDNLLRELYTLSCSTVVISLEGNRNNKLWNPK
jgi:hypothetical protein